MDEREIAIILLNMSLDMDYADAKPYGKESVDMLKEEISKLKSSDSSLYYVLETIARTNDDVSILIDGTEED